MSPSPGSLQAQTTPSDTHFITSRHLLTCNRCVICSIVRLVSLVEHQATTWPTFDPSWYASEPVVLSILEVNIATTMASLPVFWPYLRRNIDKILITHEVEVKVTEHFTQIDDRASENQFPDEEGAERERKGPGDQAYTPWGSDGKKKGAGVGLGNNTSVVMLRDLGPSSTGGSETTDTGLPFDGNRSHEPGHSQHSRVNFLSRGSKEGLLPTR